MTPLVSPELDAYIRELIPARDPVIAEMEAYAAEHDVPIVGPAVATLLEVLARSIGAARVFELGSAIGYSTAFFARAVGKGGQVFYTDGSEENARRAKGYLERMGFDDRVTIKVGDAVTSLEATTGYYDVIFIDVDKDGYPAALQAAAPRVRRGGYLLADNVLWSGKVVDSRCATPRRRASGRSTSGSSRSRSTVRVIVPLRDGVAIARGSSERRGRDRGSRRFRALATEAEPDLLEGALLVATSSTPPRTSTRRGGRSATRPSGSARSGGNIGRCHGALPRARLRGDDESYDAPSNSSVARVLARARHADHSLDRRHRVARRAGIELAGSGCRATSSSAGRRCPRACTSIPSTAASCATRRGSRRASGRSSARRSDG